MTNLVCKRRPVTASRARNYYELLGIGPDERDPAVIEGAALTRACLVRTYQLVHEAESTRQLNEIAVAMDTLLDPVRRHEYDRGLRNHQQAAEGCSPALRSPGRRRLLFRLCANRLAACDLQLVCRDYLQWPAVRWPA